MISVANSPSSRFARRCSEARVGRTLGARENAGRHGPQLRSPACMAGDVNRFDVGVTRKFDE
jgi:hypothetical protein